MALILSKNFIVRKNIDGTNILYDKSSNMRYHVTDKLFTFLYLFKQNAIDLNDLLSHFKSIDIQVEDILDFLSRPDMKNLLVSSSMSDRTDMLLQSSIAYSSIQKKSEFTEYTPERVDFLITKKCNLRCKHCFENASPLENVEFFNLEVLRTIFQQLDDANVKTLKITGGEPFYHPQFQSILELTANARFETIILTNGMLLTENIMRLVKASNIKLGISLDGITSKTHDFLRGTGSFQILYKKLQRLGKLGVDLTLTFTANKINEHELEELSAIAFNDLGVRCLFVNRLRPIGRAICNTEMFIPDNEYISIQERVDRLSMIYGKNRIALSDDSLPMDTINAEPLSATTPLVCAAGNTLLCMDQFLNVYPCIYGQGNNDYIMGNLYNNSLIEIWQSEKWLPFRGKTTLSQIRGCDSCPKQNTCGIKNCRLKPVYNGLGFFDHVDYCNGHLNTSM